MTFSMPRCPNASCPSSTSARSASGLALGCCVQHFPIFITVGDDELFALDMDSFKMFSMKQPQHEWSWCDLPLPPLIKSMDVTSIAVGSDGCTIFASTDSATFAFDIVNSEWKQSSNCSLPLAGHANYVHALGIFVGLSRVPGTYGHLCFCSKLGGDDENVRLSKENLLLKDPVNHVGATLVYLGGSEPGFCLVECVSTTQDKTVDMQLEECDQLVNCVDEAGGGNCGELHQNVDEGDGASGSMQHRYLYRLTTFSLSFDNNGDLTTDETCVEQCYKVPEEVSEAIYLANPVAFWL
ncbi:hypothetical protein BDA96_02G449800 [Sorghum bicolor]|uniref:Uncharacterized protein n=2 Tax=Sorghum bicolor TaxID=4558 RepID=A0A1B6QGJ3_SORBI|nr:hypothetical protein BDA96_02G449800 [Sorghum bicolor]KXG37029.1 hypothetical protein SORBI_3002G429100 [Sorghum bicolor]OQU90554.1 hypothetical protein SORBI_3002G429100 [Sorghum bicolor]